MTALALREDQTSWDANQLAVLRSTGIDEDVTEPELNAFLHECQRRRLDPFTRQIYLLGRWDGQKRRKVYRSQTSIDGFRLIARRAADEARESIEYEDTLWCGPDGRWLDVWLADEAPAACKVTVLRNGKRFPATAKYSGYVQLNRDNEPMGLWRKMPDNQISKCAEALALRKAFPEELGSLYTDDEMAQADNPQTVAATAEVVRDRPASSSPATAAVGEDEQWMDAAVARTGTLPDKAAATAMWAEVAEKHHSGAISRRQADSLADFIKARVADLEAEPEPEIIEGTVVTPPVSGLEPGDPWLANIESISSSEDAETAIADVQQAVRSKSMNRARADLIIAAIGDRKQYLLSQMTRPAA